MCLPLSATATRSTRAWALGRLSYVFGSALSVEPSSSNG
eukprot:CAMPEP_0195073256 /NCGR_PEP_ID=MMETSP0448-20130528/16631_1 /TAXON_ID=66468 /ORGANISM="Heterocapsa triquestra, Strain CCMP 448" /LENGTH=38 /DNA_ID= /DNA_START= /DNA_END= /DNA_ORIENTATION=